MIYDTFPEIHHSAILSAKYDTGTMKPRLLHMYDTTVKQLVLVCEIKIHHCSSCKKLNVMYET